ncbi:MAG: MogA/MoaB family molybdenum cofactor biosynthesis protein [Phycisphaeraceae bacterium]|nr:molybdenum cofactor biosynthesis protein [Phycisphaerae bacterium]MCP4014152.1 MogA/MoaB family molybdenum cofactor biosynthesis protein [Phycisphaeraceae bacterium]MCP4067556.1 MogA/MoaB family molybdenum cofactor biosynthesis protein [Phycisphaeraceae bacterium]MCP4794794.1 MogA/MoaB family molybdenum cofactor biosynthesis protein [Phycisphaeraceae bacterium]MCP4937897.1 MogA/MoaB family molybdenum cofactor biosynthesis protein [Phycisphaeraceae bacterium]
MSVESHESAANRRAASDPPRLHVLTVSDTRTRATDRGGDRLEALLVADGLTVLERDLVPDDPARVRTAIEAAVADPRVDAIAITGGTGIAPRDGTVEVVRDLIDVELDGYGERFRALSVDAIGVAGLLSRATAGVIRRDVGGGLLVFSMPGSVHAVETATGELVIPLLRHAIHEVRR